jgi:hypothetical protein
MPVLLKLQADWADEFNVYGFEVISKKDWMKLQEAIHEIKYPKEVYFGTNEAITLENPDSTLRMFNAKEITPLEAATLYRLFPQYGGRCEFGWVPDIFGLLES